MSDIKKKLTLEDLELESIVMSLDEQDAAELLGGCPRCGSVIFTHTCFPGCKIGSPVEQGDGFGAVSV